MKRVMKIFVKPLANKRGYNYVKVYYTDESTEEFQEVVEEHAKIIQNTRNPQIMEQILEQYRGSEGYVGNG